MCGKIGCPLLKKMFQTDIFENVKTTYVWYRNSMCARAKRKLKVHPVYYVMFNI